jgi:nucleotide-binding universal stress UspA family protein
MAQHLIVPIDGSEASWRGFDVALALARRFGADVELVQVESDPVDAEVAREQLWAGVEQRGQLDVRVTTNVQFTTEPIAVRLSELLEASPDSLVVMASHGKGRSAAIVGSVADEILQRTFGPIVLVGPKVEHTDFTGPLVITVDGSNESESALPLGVAWAVELSTTPWIVHVSGPSKPDTGGDLAGAVYLSRLAAELREASDHRIEFDELHDSNPTGAICDYAARHEASLIVTSSHGRSGLSRLAMGSVTAGFVRHATCPVLVFRLPHLANVRPD